MTHHEDQTHTTQTDTNNSPHANEQTAHDEAPASSNASEQTPDLAENAAQDAAQASIEVNPIEELERNISELKEQVLREKAENQNLRQRHERDLANAHKYATERLIKDLIPIADSLELGIQAAQQGQENAQQFIEGAEMTLKLMLDTLARHGVEMINPLEQPFNPEFHEAVSALVNDTVAPNTVLHVTQKGYVLHGRSIRPAQVVISRAS